MVSFEHTRVLSPNLAGEALRTDSVRAGVIVNDEAFRALSEEWTRLFDQVENPSLCATHGWALSWWETFGAKGQLFIVTIRDANDQLAAVIPFFEERPRNPLAIRRLRLLGDLGRDGGFGMTEEPILLIRAGWERPALDAVAQLLRPHLQAGRWDMVFFRALHETPECPFTEALNTLRSRAFIRPDYRNGSDFATLPESWAIYRKQLSKSMRDNLGYYPRLLTRDGHDWHIRTISEPAEMEAAVARLTELHQARAESQKGQRHCNHIHGCAQHDFLVNLLTRLSATGEAFISELVANGEVIAAQAFVQSGDQLMVYYSGYRDEWYKYSPIFVIDAHVFKEALERGVRKLDFLRNIGLWKTRWGAESGTRLRRIAVVPFRPDCLLRYSLFFSQQLVQKNVIDRLPILRAKLARKIGQAFNKLQTRQGQAVQMLLPALPYANKLSPVTHLVLHHR